MRLPRTTAQPLEEAEGLMTPKDAKTHENGLALEAEHQSRKEETLTSDMEIDEEPAVSIRPSDSNEEPTAPTKHAATPSAAVLSESKEDVAQATLASASLPKDQHHPRNRAGEQAPAKHDHREGLKNPSSRVYTAEELAGLKLMQRSADEHSAKNADRNARKDPQETKHRTPEDGHVKAPKPWNYPNDVKKGTTVPLEQSQDTKRGDHSKDEWADITRRKPLQRSAEESNLVRKYPKEAANGAMSKDEIETSQVKKRKAESEEGRGGSAKQPTRKKLDKPPRPVYSNPKTEAWAQTWTDVWQKYREANRVETKCLALQGDVDLSSFMVALAESELATVGQRIQAHEARLQQWERDGVLDMIAAGRPAWSAAAIALVYDQHGFDVVPAVSESTAASSTPHSWGVFFNLTNAIAGASIIYIPHAMADGGFLPVLGLLLLCGGITWYAMNILIVLGHHHHVQSYEDLAQLAFGVPGYLAVCFFQFTFSFGANCSYLLVIADTLPVVIGRLCKMHFAHGEPVPSSQTSWYLRLVADRNICVTLVAVLVLLPICIHRSFASLEKFAGVSVLSVVVCTGVIVYECMFHKDEYVAESRGFMYDYVAIHPDIFPALGTIAFAYVCQHQTFLLYNTMSPATPRGFADISRAGVAVSVALIFAMSIPGYLLFLQATRSDIFLNFTNLSYVEMM
ncbi:hypothetical protein DYB37_000062 [Aphanomyces astaci]|uniref:Amino acid transporter transmembrane domain-containing protein n=1 Tax=Aphanomyces astaci TaxID=112090 RepID=A0A3R7FGU7_APHAT|nr:hypothetical protein DYB37_000062 [Aphanomyces astaci]